MKRSLTLSLIGALVLLGSVVGAYYVSWLIVNPPPMLSVGLQGTVSISVNGREVVRQTDLPTNAFYQLLQNILNGIALSPGNGWNTQCLVFSSAQGTSDLGTITVGSTNFSPITSGGNPSCMYAGVWVTSNNFVYTVNWTSSVPQPLWVGIGVGTGTVGRNDKALFTKLAVAPATFTLNTQNPIGFTIAGSITISGTASITESGLYYINCAQTYPNCFGTGATNAYWALMLQHDTFNAVSVNPGDVVTVAYTINMPTSCTQSITTNCTNLGLAYLIGNCLTHSDVSGGLYTPFCLTHPGTIFTGSSTYSTTQAALNPLIALFDNSVSPAKTASATTVSVVWLQNNNYINIYGVAQAPLGLYDTVIYSFTIAGSGGLSAQVLQYKTTSSPINLVAGQAVGFQLQGP